MIENVVVGDSLCIIGRRELGWGRRGGRGEGGGKLNCALTDCQIVWIMIYSILLKGLKCLVFDIIKRLSNKRIRKIGKKKLFMKLTHIV